MRLLWRFKPPRLAALSLGLFADGCLAYAYELLCVAGRTLVMGSQPPVDYHAVESVSVASISGGAGDVGGGVVGEDANVK